MVAAMLSTRSSRPGRGRRGATTTTATTATTATTTTTATGGLRHPTRPQRRCLRTRLACEAATPASPSTPSPAAATRRVLLEAAVVGLPILAAALSEPLLTLVDTAAVGRTCGVLELAALGVNTGLFGFLSTTSAFLVTSVTACAAGALAADAASPAGAPRRRFSELLGQSVVLAAALGLLAALTLTLAPNACLKLLGVTPGTPLSAASRTYLAWRVASVPSIPLLYVCVGAALGAGNSAAPAFGVVAAALLNAAGDWSLVVWLRHGLAGAAAATALSSWAGCGLVLASLARGGLAPSFGVRALSLAAAGPLLAASGALAVAQVCNAVAYGATTSAAAAGGPACAAAHQLALQFWWLLSYAPMPLYLAATALVARDAGARDGAAAAAAAAAALRLGLAAGVLLALANTALPPAAALFTTDADVRQLAAATVPLGCAAQLLASLNTAAEGAFAGAGRLRHVAASSALGAALGVATALAVGGLSGAWWGLLFFEGVRTACHAIRWTGLLAELRAIR